MVFKASKKKGKAKKKKGRIKRLIAICTAISMLPNVIAVLFMSAALVIGAGTIYSTLFGDEVLEEDEEEYEITLKTTCVCGCRKVKGPADGSGNTGSTGNLDQTVGGSTDEEYIWNFLKAQKYDDVAIAGIMGNFYAESLYKPWTVGGHISDPDFGKTVDNHYVATTVNAFGLAQWRGERRENMVAVADAAGKKWYDVECQMTHFMNEINGNSYIASRPENLNNCQSTSLDYKGSGSTGVFLKNFERAGNGDVGAGKRLYGAYEALKKYGDLSKATESTDTTGYWALTGSPSTNKIWVKNSTLASAKGSDNSLLALTYDVKHEAVLAKKKEKDKKDDKTDFDGFEENKNVKIPSFSGDEKNFVDHVLPGAYAINQYLNIRTVMAMSQCHQEGYSHFQTGQYGKYTMPDSYPSGLMQFFGVAGSNKITRETTGKWRGYRTVTEAVVDYGFYLNVNMKYAGNFEYITNVSSKYAQGYKEQIKGVAYTDYCCSGTHEQYYAGLLSHSEKYKMFDEDAVVEEYLRANNLEDEYKTALQWIVTYEKVYTEAYKNSAAEFAGVNKLPNVSGISPSTGSNSGDGKNQPVVDEDGVEGVDWHWECDCKIPCSKCSCHDNTGSSSGGAVSGDLTLKEDKGKFQALWTDSSGKNMTQDDWDKLVQKYPPFNSSSYLDFVGVKDRPANDYSAVSEDRFKKQFTDGVGYIHYTQGANGNSDMNGLIQHRGCTFSQAHLGQNFCGGFCTSMVMSTYLHRYVTPIEIAIAAETYSERHGKSIPMFADTEKTKSGVFLMSGASALLNEQRFNGEALFETSYKNGGNGTTPIPSQSELDSIIEKNGAVIFVARPDYHGLTGSGHYIWIRGKTSDGKYLLGNSTANATTYKNLNYGWSYSELQSVDKAQQYCIILPTKAYNNYISQASVKEEVDGDEAELGGGTPLKSGSKTRNNIVRFGMQFLGRPYVWGGTSLTNGCDCSGFVLSVYAHFGVSLPHQSTAMRSVGKSVPNPSPATMLPGDILCYEGHVALYDGKGNMLEAQSRRTGIMNNRAWNDKPVVCVRRIPINQIKVPK